MGAFFGSGPCHGAFEGLYARLWRLYVRREDDERRNPVRVFLAAVLAMIPVVNASAAEWPSADTYRPLTNNCALYSDDKGGGEDWCKQATAVWDKDYDGAIHGRYQGQRNVSFCLSTGCREFFRDIIRPNKILGCAWRIVILKSGHLDVDETDTANFKMFCGPRYVDDAGRAAAEAQAATMLKMLGR